MVVQKRLILSSTDFNITTCVRDVRYEEDRGEARLEFSWNINAYTLFLCKSYSTETLKIFLKMYH